MSGTHGWLYSLVLPSHFLVGPVVLASSKLDRDDHEGARAAPCPSNHQLFAYVTHVSPEAKAQDW
jgi:hypothetical protein